MSKRLKAYIIVDREAQGPKWINEKDIIYTNGDPFFVDSYGMGSIHWPIILVNNDLEIEKRCARDDYWRAVDRLRWAKKYAKKEVSELKSIIGTYEHAVKRVDKKRLGSYSRAHGRNEEKK